MKDDPNISTHGSDAGLITNPEDIDRRVKATISRERDRRRREESELEKRLQEIRR